MRKISIWRSSHWHGASGGSEWEEVDGGWVDSDRWYAPVPTLTELLEFGMSDRIEIETEGVTVDEVLEALMPADYLIEDEVFVTVNGTAYGPFFRGGWLELDLEYRARGIFMPAHRPLAAFSVLDLGPDYSHWVDEVVEVRPGMLFRRHDLRWGSGRDDWDEIIHCPPQELYLGHVRDLLFDHGGEMPALDEAIRRTIAGEGSRWRGDQLEADGERSLEIEVSIAPDVLAALRREADP